MTRPVRKVKPRERPVRPTRPARRVKKPVTRGKAQVDLFEERREVRETTGRVCPECGLEQVGILSVKGTMKPPELVTKYRCHSCFHVHEVRKPREDVCAHGAALIVPCESCGRSWESIERGSS